jgi:hypothetical protein
VHFGGPQDDGILTTVRAWYTYVPDHVAVTSAPWLGCTRPAQPAPDGDARLTSSPAAVDQPPQPEKPPPPFSHLP